MEKETYTIKHNCLFCESELVLEKGEQPDSGDQVLCRKCGEQNDYDSVREVTKERIVNDAKNDLKNHIPDMFK